MLRNLQVVAFIYSIFLIISRSETELNKYMLI